MFVKELVTLRVEYDTDEVAELDWEALSKMFPDVRIKLVSTLGLPE